MDNFDIGVSGNNSGIYCFENLIDGKKYVGRGQLLKERKSIHFSLLNRNKDSLYFQNAWNKYGKENFKFWIVEECSKELLNKKEIYWIKKLHSHFSEWGYNLTWGGKGVSGYKHTEEAKQKISNSEIGEKHWNFGRHPSLETIQKRRDNMPDQSGENNPFYGKKHSEETIEKMREVKLGKHSSPETIQKLRELNTGKNSSVIIKKEIIQQIKDMLDKNIKIIKISKELNVSEPTIHKVKTGGYQYVYGIEGNTIK